MEELELHDVGARRDHDREQDPAGARVGCRPRIRDHEEGEQDEGPVLQAMERNGKRVAEPERPRDEQGHPAGEEGPRHVGAPRAIDDQTTRRCEQEGEHGQASPLPRGDPYLSGGEHHQDQREVGRVEHVLTVNAEDELAPDGHHRRERGKPHVIGAEEEAERQTGDESALRVEPGEAGHHAAPELRQKRCGQDGEGPARVDLEAQPDHAVPEQRGEHGDLVEPRVEPRRRHRRAPAERRP